MNIACLLGKHRFSGCRCDRCGKKRHTFVNSVCTACGETCTHEWILSGEQEYTMDYDSSGRSVESYTVKTYRCRFCDATYEEDNGPGCE